MLVSCSEDVVPPSQTWCRNGYRNVRNGTGGADPPLGRGMEQMILQGSFWGLMQSLHFVLSLG